MPWTWQTKDLIYPVYCTFTGLSVLTNWSFTKGGIEVRQKQVTCPTSQSWFQDFIPGCCRQLRWLHHTHTPEERQPWAGHSEEAPWQTAQMMQQRIHLTTSSFWVSVSPAKLVRLTNWLLWDVLWLEDSFLNLNYQRDQNFALMGQNHICNPGVNKGIFLSAHSYLCLFRDVLTLGTNNT